jgi:two-component system response regulator HydG
MAANILVVDDDPFTQQLFRGLLRPPANELTVVGTLAEAQTAFAAGDFNLVILDQRLPDGNGLDFFSRIRVERPRQVVILITGYAAVQDAIRAVREGLFDYLTKPFENLDELEAVILRALEIDRVYREIHELRSAMAGTAEQPMFGNSRPMTDLLAQVKHIAPLDTTVLIEGESGTGKEVFAKLIHSASSRAKQPMVAVNCGALHEALLEAALFGYEKGAFTGAAKTTGGYFEQANGGTLFLDEITDMSPKLQASLLRVLQERSFNRLGSASPRPSDFRLICATNKSLEAEVREGRFRSDLYYRINVVSLHIPPLREHKEDVMPLALYFLSHFNQKFGKGAGPFTPSASNAMEHAYWSGNIRELRHAVERAVAVNVQGPIGPADLGLASRPGTAVPASEEPRLFAEAREEFERDYFSNLLKWTSGSVAEAARLSGMARQNLYGHIHRLGLDHARMRAGAEGHVRPERR